MTTKRRPLKPSPVRRITPEALEAFRNMQLCSTSAEWWEWHAILHRALGLKPWQWPAIEHPESAAPYPAGSPAAFAWKPDLEARERYRTLEEAGGAEGADLGVPPARSS
jgi:hypothetical protein